MEDEQYETDNKDEVNKSSGDVECKKTQQPKNNEDCGD